MTTGRITDLMQPAPTSVRATATLREVATVLTYGEIGIAVVQREGLMVGLVSERDVVRAIAEGEDVDEARVEDVMAVDISTIGPEATRDAAAEQMLDGAIRHLPVVADGKVLGIVSIRDLLAAERAVTA